MSEPRVLSVVAPGNGSGKTRLIASILASRPGAITAVKFTTVYRDGANCPRTETECACRSLHGRSTIIADPSVLALVDTDTGRFVAAGARRVLWCLCRPEAHEEAWSRLSALFADEEHRIILEGNRAARVVRPRAVVMVVSPAVPRSRWKDDTAALMEKADLAIVNRIEGRERETDALADEVRAMRRGPVVVLDVTAPLFDRTGGPGGPGRPLAGLIDSAFEASARSEPVLSLSSEPRTPAGGR